MVSSWPLTTQKALSLTSRWRTDTLSHNHCRLERINFFYDAHLIDSGWYHKLLFRLIAFSSHVTIGFSLA